MATGARFSRLKDWIVEILTDTDLDAEFDNILTNLDAAGSGSGVTDVSSSQTTSDPYTGDVTQVPTATLDYLRQLAYMIKQISGKSQWQIDAAAIGSKGGDVASINALVLGKDGNSFDITGTTTIQSIGTLGAGSVIILQFDDALTIEHHATDLILPSGNHIKTRTGDIFMFYEYATGDWRLIASNRPVDSKNADVVSTAALPVLGPGFSDVTGTVTVTSIDSIGIGSLIHLQFDAALTLTHHATDMILPSGNDIVTKAGDVFTFFEYASGDWLCISANRPVESKGADIASANALPVLAPGHFDVTGTTSITSIDSIGIGSVIELYFDGILTLTYHATDLLLPTGTDITTAAGDIARFVEYASGDWRCVSYSKADGFAVGFVNNMTAGTYIIAESLPERTTSSGSIKIKEIKINFSGTLKIQFTGKANNNGDVLRIYRNGAVVGASQNMTTSYADYVEDIANWSPGDLVQIYSNPGVGNPIYAKDFLIGVANPPIGGREATL